MILNNNAISADSPLREAKLASLLALVEGRKEGLAATICALRGDVEIVDPAAPRLLTPEAGWRLHRGCSLRVAPEGGALVRIDAGVDAGRELWIRGGETVAVEALVAGRFAPRLESASAPRTPAATVVARRNRAARTGAGPRFRYAHAVAAAGLGGILCLAAGPAALRFATHCVLGIPDAPASSPVETGLPLASGTATDAAPAIAQTNALGTEASSHAAIAPESYVLPDLAQAGGENANELTQRLARLESQGQEQAQRIDSLIGLLSGERGEAERLRDLVEEANRRERELLDEKLTLEARLGGDSAIVAAVADAAPQSIAPAPSFAYLAHTFGADRGMGEAIASAISDSRPAASKIIDSNSRPAKRVATPPLDPRQRERERIVAARAAAGWAPPSGATPSAVESARGADAAAAPGVWLSMLQLREKMRGRAASALVRGMKDAARVGSD